MKKRVHLYYSGQVQGVGFRYTARDAAEDLRVRGWVKNLSDGRVEIVAESDEEGLNLFTRKIKESFSRYIREVDARWEPASGEYKDFRIEF